MVFPGGFIFAGLDRFIARLAPSLHVVWCLLAIMRFGESFLHCFVARFAAFFPFRRQGSAVARADAVHFSIVFWRVGRRFTGVRWRTEAHEERCGD